MKKYNLVDYARLLNNKGLLVKAEIAGMETLIVEHLTYNSKEVIPGTLFICKGATFKEEYLEEAINRGAIGYVSDKQYEKHKDVPHILVKDIRRAMADLAELHTDFAWQKLNLIGIGGTKGKSTSAYFMKSIVDDYMEDIGGRKSAIISSVDVYDGKIARESHITTPEAVELHRHFRNAIDSDITFLQMEVSSQALKYNRVDNIEFDVGIFLNISEDHISDIEHPDFEDYFASKLLMFKRTRNAIVNLDADFADRILESADSCSNVMTFSTKNPDADIYAYDIRKESLETVFRVRTKDFDEEFRLTMPGLFNIENALGVIGAAMCLYIPLRYIRSGLYRTKISGRMELYTSSDQNIIAVVDFAHNKLSFEKLFASVKAEYPDYNIVSIFGCPGNKAFSRRKDLGTIAGGFSNKIYLTMDDPGTEDVDQIIDQIAEYVEKQNCPYEKIVDREEAIRKAVDTAEGKTLLVVAGRGHETTQKMAQGYVPCKSDRECVLETLNEYNKRTSPCI
ncbi:MAG: UDP-N-acetylmuramoyl-L-alanyl-D-glutamate--2,6-diaminopimelate ligase [Eubacteriaceae bacterium]|nr:UDP-N-acetylmuramoyl-L-alanyl-D-glutamate--2,6-diaminopimelate ligase [Eubacteriaceae bacterium]